MALTTLDVYKQLPKTNCKDCDLPTCMAFAMQVAAKQKALTDCPHISDETKTDLSAASSPPMKLVKIGRGDNEFEFGQETVMFRHDEKFHHPCGIAVRVPSSLSTGDALKRVERINSSVFERVGEKLKVSFCAVEIDGCDDAVERVKQISDKSNVPIILIGKNGGSVDACVEAIKTKKPLLYKADSSNFEEFSEIAARAKVPLVAGGESVEELAELTQRIKERGVEEIVLGVGGKNPGETLQLLTETRRAALLKNFKPLGFPSIVEINNDSKEIEIAYASIFAIKYAGVVLVNDLEAWQLLPLMTSIQDIYTNPQVPNAVEAKLFEIGNVNENSPVMFTTNFALTYFSVAGEVERSKIPAYICVVDTEGMGVLNAYAGDKMSPEKVIKTIQEQKVSERVKHRKLIIPGLIPVYRAELEESSEWEEVIIGPKTAREIPSFLNKIWN